MMHGAYNVKFMNIIVVIWTLRRGEYGDRTFRLKPAVVVKLYPVSVLSNVLCDRHAAPHTNVKYMC